MDLLEGVPSTAESYSRGRALSERAYSSSSASLPSRAGGQAGQAAPQTMATC